ncbi:CDP-alcohol phosphatidyltransferase family protein [Devosia rhodophyticola]|uniref:CDP-alcohol phosphatidyltransferase family protein n=1 Tax=Devosia rhodophyticola TaxID=3026423 RepID=A0ABY7YYR2_9HYPH|nr:CDP-alcohol phosphatidyltransferase family protein [Devosia rhodophyticola]WDR06297.1 CDP-alcohol phosphatidyltransferase family protein [Devosia rhodophyticola]
MFDSVLIPPQERVLAPPARLLAKLGATANGVTIVGFITGMLAVPAIALHYYWLGLALIVANRLMDGLDGAIARQRGPTDRGAFLDIALDFFFYAAIPFAFVLADPVANGLAGSFLLLSFIGTGSSFLAFAVIAERRGLKSLSMPKKGLYYLGGITEGAETILLFALICVFPHTFALFATVFAVLALVTTLTRWWWGWKSFSMV